MFSGIVISGILLVTQISMTSAFITGTLLLPNWLLWLCLRQVTRCETTNDDLIKHVCSVVVNMRFSSPRSTLFISPSSFCPTWSRTCRKLWRSRSNGSVTWRRSSCTKPTSNTSRSSWSPSLTIYRARLKSQSWIWKCEALKGQLMSNLKLHLLPSFTLIHELHRISDANSGLNLKQARPRMFA